MSDIAWLCQLSCLVDNRLVKLPNKPTKWGSAAFVLLSPALFVLGVLSIPYTMVTTAVSDRRERKFRNSMRTAGRTMDWASFMREINSGRGTLIVERFSFKGPVRMWWTEENVYEACPYPAVHGLTMCSDAKFETVRDWCHRRYTSDTGGAFIVDGNREQWRSIRGHSPLRFRDGIRYIEVPPRRRLSKLS